MALTGSAGAGFIEVFLGGLGFAGGEIAGSGVTHSRLAGGNALFFVSVGMRDNIGGGLTATAPRLAACSLQMTVQKIADEEGNDEQSYGTG